MDERGDKGGKDRRSGGATETIIRACWRFIDRDEHSDLRVVGREESDETRVVDPLALLV